MFEYLKASVTSNHEVFLKSGVVPAMSGLSTRFWINVVGGLWFLASLVTVFSIMYALTGICAGWVPVAWLTATILLNYVSRLQERTKPLSAVESLCERALKLIADAPAALAWRDAVLAEGRELTVEDLRYMHEIGHDEAIETKRFINFKTPEAVAADKLLMFKLWAGLAVLLVLLATLIVLRPSSTVAASAMMLAVTGAMYAAVHLMDGFAAGSTYAEAEEITPLLRGATSDSALCERFAQRGYVTCREAGAAALRAENKKIPASDPRRACKLLHGLSAS